jgi:hypothetical protein
MEGADVTWCCKGDGTGSRHLVPMSAAGIRHLAHSRDGARKGAVSALSTSSGGRRDPTEATMGAGEGPFHREELGGGVVVLLGRGPIRDGGHALAQLLESSRQ